MTDIKAVTGGTEKQNEWGMDLKRILLKEIESKMNELINERIINLDEIERISGEDSKSILKVIGFYYELKIAMLENVNDLTSANTFINDRREKLLVKGSYNYYSVANPERKFLWQDLMHKYGFSEESEPIQNLMEAIG